MESSTPPRDLTRTVFAVLFHGALLVSSYWILRPFLAPLIWATLLVVATWPMLARLQTLLAGRRWLAVAGMEVLLLLVFVVPLTLILGVLVENAPAIADWLKALPERALQPAPDWVRGVPLVGGRLADTWSQWVAEGRPGLQARLAPYADDLAAWFVTQIGGIGLTFLHFTLTLVLAGILYAKGEAFAESVRRFARRLAGAQGDRATMLAAAAVRAVAFGVVVTALMQAAMGGLGLVVAGVPAAGILTCVMFVSSVAQVGAVPVLALAAIWLFAQGSSGWGIALLVWAVAVGSLDNVIRPLLIRKGVDLPLILVFSGVVGGLIAFGAVGLFAGPVVLALCHTLLSAWVAEGDAPASSAAGGDGPPQVHRAPS